MLVRHSASKLVFWSVAVALVVTAPSVHAQDRQEYVERHMGMPVRVVVYAPREAADRGARAAFATIAALEDIMSDYRPTSEVSRLPARARRWTGVSAPLFAVLARGKEIAASTDGAFDPTVGPLVALWREARRTRLLPARARLDAARRRVGWRLMELDFARQRVRFARQGMKLDLGGIAKGFILQVALDTLRGRGLSRAMLEAGGDIVVGDAPPDRDGWRIVVPGADTALARRAAMLVNAAISTSGPASQFVDIGGVRYSHVVNPRTGLGLTTGTSATVIAPDAATADALATAFTVLGASHPVANPHGVFSAVWQSPP